MMSSMRFMGPIVLQGIELCLLFQLKLVRQLFLIILIVVDDLKSTIDAPVDVVKTYGDDESESESEKPKVETKEEPLKRKRACSDSPNPKGPPKRTSVYQSAAEIAREGMRDLGKSMTSAMGTRFDECLPLLSEMREDKVLTKDEYVKYSRFLMNNERCASMFMGVDEDVRAEWLKLEYSEAFA
jgi:hypothetical protein